MAGEVDVVVTGMGVALPLGLCVEQAWARCARGESAIGPLLRFDPSAYPCRAAGEPPAFDLTGALRTPKNEKLMSPAVRCAVRAARAAVLSSGLVPAEIDPFRLALYTGSGQTGLESADLFEALAVAWSGDEAADFANLGGRASRLLDRCFSLRTLSNAGLGLLSSELGARGPSGNFVQGDTASALAVDAGLNDLREGRADVAVVGGYDSLLDVSTYLAYDKAGLLSWSDPGTAYRPFDRRRDGLVLGEGAAFLVLERGDDARVRGASVLAEVVGSGCAMEAVDALEAKACESAAEAALAEAAGEVPVDLVVAHGIGTPEDDRREARLLEALFGPAVPVTALKSLTGYLGAASAAAELCLAVLAVRRRCAPPIARHASADADCTLDLVAGRARPLRAPRPTAVCLSWSWSGQCTALAVRAAC
jgi:3-oxoacyl-(acyl-carrier-protein) synthase